MDKPKTQRSGNIGRKCQRKECNLNSLSNSLNNFGGYMDLIWDFLSMTALITNIMFYIYICVICHKYLVGETDL